MIVEERAPHDLLAPSPFGLLASTENAMLNVSLTAVGPPQQERLKKEGRHRLGGTGAATAAPDWGES